MAMQDYEIEPWDSASTMRYPGKPMPGYEEGLNMAARKGLQMLNPVETVKGFSHMASGLANDAARAVGARPPERNPSFVEDMSQLANNLAEDPLGTAADMVMAPGSIPGMFTGRLVPPAVKNTVRSARGTELAYPHMPHLTPEKAAKMLADDGNYRIHASLPQNIPKIQKEGFRGGNQWPLTTLGTSKKQITSGKPAGASNTYWDNREGGVIMRRSGNKSDSDMPMNYDGPHKGTVPTQNIVGYVTKDGRPIPGMQSPWFPKKPKWREDARISTQPVQQAINNKPFKPLPPPPAKINLP